MFAEFESKYMERCCVAMGVAPLAGVLYSMGASVEVVGYLPLKAAM
jgi:hypothetical protein